MLVRCLQANYIRKIRIGKRGFIFGALHFLKSTVTLINDIWHLVKSILSTIKGTNVIAQK